MYEDLFPKLDYNEALKKGFFYATIDLENEIDIDEEEIGFIDEIIQENQEEEIYDSSQTTFESLRPKLSRREQKKLLGFSNLKEPFTYQIVGSEIFISPKNYSPAPAIRLINYGESIEIETLHLENQEISFMSTYFCLKLLPQIYKAYYLDHSLLPIVNINKGYELRVPFKSVKLGEDETNGGPLEKILLFSEMAKEYPNRDFNIDDNLYVRFEEYENRAIGEIITKTSFDEENRIEKALLRTQLALTIGKDSLIHNYNYF